MRVSELTPQRILRNLSRDDLQDLAKSQAIPTNSNNLLFRTGTQSRSAAMTHVVTSYTNGITRILEEVKQYLTTKECIEVDRQISLTPPYRFRVRLFVAKTHPQLALMFHENFYAALPGSPDITVVDIPEWREPGIFIFPQERTTLILGSDYYGEAKMASLRMAMYIARQDLGALGIHAGSKLFTLLGNNEKLEKRGILVFGLSGTGKTSIVCEDHDLDDPETIEILQDDIVILAKNGAAYGTERNFYVKTDTITAQALLLPAVRDEFAILENVFVDEDGKVDFDNHSITTNGRAIIPRNRIRFTSSNINLDNVHVIFFNTRRYDIPPIGRLTSPEQAVAFFMLGESIITSADDPTRMGETKRVVGFNPFIIDHPEKDGQRLLEILKSNPHIQCYLLNTGKVGGIENGVKITPQDTFHIVEKVIRGGLEWHYDPYLGYETPRHVPGIDISKFDPYQRYGARTFKEMMEALKADRMSHLKAIPGLDPAIIASLQ